MFRSSDVASSSDSTPVVSFRVKRWAGRGNRSSPLHGSESFVAPTPKVPHFPPVPETNHWHEGHISPGYRPPQLVPPGHGGLQPPPIFRQSNHVGAPSIGGLHFSSPPLRVHSPSWSCLDLALPRPKACGMPSPGPLTGGSPADVVAISDPVGGRVPTGSSAFSTKELYTHLKAQHVNTWLSLLDAAGEASSLFCDTRHSALAAS